MYINCNCCCTLGELERDIEITFFVYVLLWNVGPHWCMEYVGCWYMMQWLLVWPEEVYVDYLWNRKKSSGLLVLGWRIQRMLKAGWYYDTVQRLEFSHAGVKGMSQGLGERVYMFLSLDKNREIVYWIH